MFGLQYLDMPNMRGKNEEETSERADEGSPTNKGSNEEDKPELEPAEQRGPKKKTWADRAKGLIGDESETADLDKRNG